MDVLDDWRQRRAGGWEERLAACWDTILVRSEGERARLGKVDS